MPRSRRTPLSVSDAVDAVRSAARRQKVMEYETYAVSKRLRRVLVECGHVSGADTALSAGLYLRVDVDGRVGGAFCNAFDTDSVSDCVAKAVSVARLMEPDPRWPGFPSSERGCPSVSGIYDKSVASLEVSVLSEMAEEMADGALSVSKDVSVPFGVVQSTVRTLCITNSNGVHRSMEDTELQAIVSCVAGTGSSVSPDCEERGQSRDCSLRMERIGARAGWVADNSLHLVDARTEETDVIFSPLSLGNPDSGLLNIVLSKVLSGQSAHQKMSYLSERIGDSLWSRHVTLVDNPVLSGRCGSRPFDDEGMPTTRTKLVEKGVLKGFVYDSYYGTASGTGSSGNAVRDVTSGAVNAAPLCLQMAPGRGSLDSLVASVDHGYLVWACQGAHTSNTETGGFSFVASPGLLIEDGEVVGGIRGAMISGGMDDLMMNAERVGADVVDFGNALMPSVLFKDVKVTTG